MLRADWRNPNCGPLRHETLCYVWFDGAWNQGFWAGIGTALLSTLFPDTANMTTPWAYPFLTREQHARKVYRDYFTECACAPVGVCDSVAARHRDVCK